MNTSSNVSGTQMPTPEQLQLQMQMQAAMLNQYGAPFFQFPNFPPQQTQDFFQMYMQGTAPGVPAVPVASEMNKQQRPSPTSSTDSGNGTISPVQQQQQTQSNWWAAPVSSQVPGAPNSYQQTGVMPQVNQMKQQQSTASPYAINNIIGASTSEKTFSTNQVAEEEKENENQRRHTLPTATVRRRRPTPYERNPLVLLTHANPELPLAHAGLSEAIQTLYHNTLQDFCAVCRDRASGYHYGVLSCEGCKGFFRRLVHSKKKLECNKGAECKFKQTPQSRTACQPCRFAMCLRVGMSKENVKEPSGRKKVLEAIDEVSPRVEVLILAFATAMQRCMTIKSGEEACACIQKFIKNVPELAALLPESEATTKKIEKMMPAMMTIRAAYSLDPVSFLTEGNAKIAEKIEKLRAGIRCTIFEEEGLAMVSGIFIMMFLDERYEGTFKTYHYELGQHFTVSESQEAGTADRLLSKMGSLL